MSRDIPDRPPTWSIGALTMPNRTVLAPLAGIGNLPFRLLAKEGGAGLVCAEMVSAKGLVHGSPKTCALLESAPAERPLSLQIFGADPDAMAEAAQIVEATAGADILDINFGCSVRKVVKTGAGVALMRAPRTAEAVLRAVRRVLDIPLTIKIRSGWSADGAQAQEIARIAVDCGVDAIAVHPRTASQGFAGRADWSLIGRVKALLPIPVIGNGDINTPEDAARMRDETGCDAVMIGRAAIGAPWLFGQVVDLLATGQYPALTLERRRAAMRRYVAYTVRHCGEAVGCRMLRSRLGWFVKGLPHNARFREGIRLLTTEAGALAAVDAYFDCHRV